MVEFFCMRDKFWLNFIILCTIQHSVLLYVHAQKRARASVHERAQGVRNRYARVVRVYESRREGTLSHR